MCVLSNPRPWTKLDSTCVRRRCRCASHRRFQAAAHFPSAHILPCFSCSRCRASPIPLVRGALVTFPPRSFLQSAPCPLRLAERRLSPHTATAASSSGSDAASSSHGPSIHVEVISSMLNGGSAASAVDPLRSPSPAASFCGRKRGADAASSSLPSASQPSAQLVTQTDPQNKKQRGPAQFQGDSALNTGAASSVGLDSLPAESCPSTPPSARSNIGGSDATMQSAPSAATAHVGTRDSEAAASASSASASSASTTSNVACAQPLFADAQHLIRGALSLANAQVHRYSPTRAPEVKRRMQELAAAEAKLRSTPAELIEDQAQAQIEDLTEWLKVNGGVSHIIDSAAGAATQEPSTQCGLSPLRALQPPHQSGSLAPGCAAPTDSVLPLAPADVLCTRLCILAPRLQLSLRDV